jgi:CDGSH-type Zn-finger protein
VTITPTDNGPYEVEGPITLVDEDGVEWNVSKRKIVYLCRCGNSQRKPFCDGHHESAGFSSCARASTEIAF